MMEPIKELREVRVGTRARVVGLEGRLRCRVVAKSPGSVTVVPERLETQRKRDSATGVELERRTGWVRGKPTTWAPTTLVYPGAKPRRRSR